MNDQNARVFTYADTTKGTSACWLFLRYIDRYGYGRIRHQGRSDRAHRVAYKVSIGAIPEGLVLDHLCHNRDVACPGGTSCIHRRCVNPNHLEAVPRVTNILRGKSFSAVNASLAACLKGHPFNKANIYRDSRGRRNCRICQREAVRRYRNRRTVP